ncbi:hypothetical protein IMG5_023260 [Ichthyophthirius multifiliis]|uniref:Uncharacterized protein n=1 Tax=Ichthyophthirius multifiliis TaxID=5932 RepID=G0QKZ1_ICHMU|nr:hypothetical protein IMG5_023260 [Ichthyophthirius multifiliis]EGR34112.1 hypothetical protein IMG5_023260 [Ichthyophthirius multifiliis]|eukprot:XP_004039416.1 hypothetical protein IMG5_023260 [Ichthyophthirius multifiliis]
MILILIMSQMNKKSKNMRNIQEWMPLKIENFFILQKKDLNNHYRNLGNMHKQEDMMKYIFLIWKLKNFRMNIHQMKFIGKNLLNVKGKKQIKAKLSRKKDRNCKIQFRNMEMMIVMLIIIINKKFKNKILMILKKFNQMIWLWTKIIKIV